MLHCTRARKKLYGSFFERSPSAGSYRGELLGLLAIHTLAAALECHFHLPPYEGKICCDNEGALHKAQEFRKRIPVGASQADIKRALRTVKGHSRARFWYEWVESHQDR